MIRPDKITVFKQNPLEKIRGLPDNLTRTEFTDKFKKRQKLFKPLLHCGIDSGAGTPLFTFPRRAWE
jgi:hypothetical protein